MSNRVAFLTLLTLALLTAAGTVHAWLHRPRSPVFERLSQCDSVEITGALRTTLRLVITDAGPLSRLKLKSPPPPDQPRRLNRYSGAPDALKFQRDGKTLLTLLIHGDELTWGGAPAEVIENRFLPKSHRLLCAWLSSEGFSLYQDRLRRCRDWELRVEEAKRLAGPAVPAVMDRPEGTLLPRQSVDHASLAAVGEALARHPATWESSGGPFQTHCFALLQSKHTRTREAVTLMSKSAVAAVYFSHRAPPDLFRAIPERQAAKVTEAAIDVVDSWHLPRVVRRASSRPQAVVMEATRVALTRRLEPKIRSGEVSGGEIAALHRAWVHGIRACEELVNQAPTLPDGQWKTTLELIRLVQAGRIDDISPRHLKNSEASVKLAAPLIRRLPEARQISLSNRLATHLLRRSQPDYRRYGMMHRALGACQLPLPELDKLYKAWESE